MGGSGYPNKVANRPVMRWRTLRPTGRWRMRGWRAPPRRRRGDGPVPVTGRSAIILLKVTIATMGLVAALTAASVILRGSLRELAGYAPGSPGGPTVESLIRADPGLHPHDKRALIRIVRMARDRFAAEAEQDVVLEFRSHR